MLEESGTLQNLSLPKQRITTMLAKAFEQSYECLFMNPNELHEATEIGSKEHWADFLKLQEVEMYVKGQMAALAQISQRKTFQSLVQMALSGNAQAAKQVQELSGIMNQQDTNRTIVLHHIPRPKTQEVN